MLTCLLDSQLPRCDGHSLSILFRFPYFSQFNHTVLTVEKGDNRVVKSEAYVKEDKHMKYMVFWTYTSN